MSNFKFLALVAISSLAVASCSRAVVNGKFTDTPSGSCVVAKTIDGTLLHTLDTIKIKENTFRHSFEIEKGKPEFVYLYYGQTKIASLLLSAGDKVSIQCDTVGNWTVEGSEDCAKLRENEMEIARLSSFSALTGKMYIDANRKMIRYVMSNSKSLTIIPVLFGKIGSMPLFNQPSDGIIFRTVADSLATVYPESKYVRMLRNEADRRQKYMDFNQLLSSAGTSSFPDLEYPDINGVRRKLSECLGKKTVVLFWDATDAGNKMFNQDNMLPLYEEFHSKGVEVYAVNYGVDKTAWAHVVRQQNLPWTNVCDIHGNSAVLWGVKSLPTVFLLSDDKLEKFESIAALRKKLSK